MRTIPGREVRNDRDAGQKCRVEPGMADPSEVHHPGVDHPGAEPAEVDQPEPELNQFETGVPAEAKPADAVGPTSGTDLVLSEPVGSDAGAGASARAGTGQVGDGAAEPDAPADDPNIGATASHGDGSLTDCVQAGPGGDDSAESGAGVHAKIQDASEQLAAVSDQLAELAGAEFHGMSEPQATRVLAELELAERQIHAVKARAASAIEADGLWATSGARSFAAWWRARTGRRAATSRAVVRTARALRDDLPHAQSALEHGRMGADHVEVLRRFGTTTPELRDQLKNAALGEEFLVEQAGRMDADSFSQVVKAWAIRADPAAADRTWRDEGLKEELFCSPVLDGYAINGWVTTEHGKAVEEALRAVIGVPAAKDDRSPATRRANALVHLARRALDSGELQPGARQRPHLGVHVDYETLQQLIEASRPAHIPEATTPEATTREAATPEVATREVTAPEAAAAVNGTSGSGGAASGGHASPPRFTIDTSLEHEQLRGVAPAAWDDGTPIPFAQLSKLACAGAVHRVIFGAEGQVLDSGREERLFTPAQTRAVIARDRCCQFPDCDAPPGEGEIHHSLWWYAHGGDTAVSNGVLLCWAHHDYVHQHTVSISALTGGGWQFRRSDGGVIASSHPPGTAGPT